MSKCMCESPNIELKNKHFLDKNIVSLILKDSDGAGLIVLEDNSAIAVFDINYCPKCGKKVESR